MTISEAIDDQNLHLTKEQFERMKALSTNLFYQLCELLHQELADMTSHGKDQKQDFEVFRIAVDNALVKFATIHINWTADMNNNCPNEHLESIVLAIAATINRCTAHINHDDKSIKKYH